MAHDVFISYSHQDKPIADAICAAIEAAGIRGWIAPRDIAPGEDWPSAIAKAIAHSRIMVLVFSASSNSSEDVGRELILASNSKLVIIPFKIENIEPEPGKQYYLARTHWLDAMNPPTKDQIAILVRRVLSILPATAPEGPAPVQPPAQVPVKGSTQVTGEKPAVGQAAPPPQKKSFKWLAWVAFAVLSLAGMYFLLGMPGLPARSPAATSTPPRVDTPTLFQTMALTPSLSEMAGTWTGSAENSGTVIQMTITFYANCSAGSVCAHFYIPTLPCSGDFQYDRLTDGLYEFQAVNKHGDCGQARDFLQLQPDDSLLYISRGDFGESRGIMQRSSLTRVSDGFDDPAYDGTFDPNQWFMTQDISLTTIQQLDGVLVFNKSSASGSENGNLKSLQSWNLDQLGSFEARLKLDRTSSGSNGNIAITLWDTAQWYAGCGISIFDPDPFLWCGSGSGHGTDFMSESRTILYGQWVLVRIEFDPQAEEFRCLVDGEPYFSWRLEDEKPPILLVTIGIWAEDGTHITAYMDDVTIGK